MTGSRKIIFFYWQTHYMLKFQWFHYNIKSRNDIYSEKNPSRSELGDVSIWKLKQVEVQY